MRGLKCLYLLFFDHLLGWGEVWHSWSSLFGWWWRSRGTGLFPAASLPRYSRGSTYPRLECTFGQQVLLLQTGTLIFFSPEDIVLWIEVSSSYLLNQLLWMSTSSDSGKIPTTDAHHSWYLVHPSRISGALYQRVATYSVNAGFPLSSWIWLSDLAKPKSQSFTTQSESKSTLDGCGKTRQGQHSSQGWQNTFFPPQLHRGKDQGMKTEITQRWK